MAVVFDLININQNVVRWVFSGISCSLFLVVHTMISSTLWIKISCFFLSSIYHEQNHSHPKPNMLRWQFLEEYIPSDTGRLPADPTWCLRALVIMECWALSVSDIVRLSEETQRLDQSSEFVIKGRRITSDHDDDAVGEPTRRRTRVSARVLRLNILDRQPVARCLLLGNCAPTCE